MRRALSLAIAAAVGLASVSPRPVYAAASTELARAKARYAKSEYQGTVDTLAPVMGDPRQRADLSAEDMVDAYRILGLSYFFLAQAAEDDEKPRLLDLAGVQFASLLFIDPDYDLDAAIDGAEAVGFFGQIKRDNQRQLDEVRKQKALDAERRLRPQVERLVIRIERDPARWTNYLPFGYPQFRNGDDKKGAVVLVLQSSMFVASTGLYLKHAFRYGWPVGQLPADPDEVDTIRTEQYLQIGAGLVFFATYAFSVYDGYKHQPPATIERQSTQPIQYDDEPSAPPPTRGAVLVPLVGHGVTGLSVMWEL
jgi:hypothetical protein